MESCDFWGLQSQTKDPFIGLSKSLNVLTLRFQVKNHFSWMKMRTKAQWKLQSLAAQEVKMPNSKIWCTWTLRQAPFKTFPTSSSRVNKSAWGLCSAHNQGKVNDKDCMCLGPEQNREDGGVSPVVDKDNRWWDQRRRGGVRRGGEIRSASVTSLPGRVATAVNQLQHRLAQNHQG